MTIASILDGMRRRLPGFKSSKDKMLVSTSVPEKLARLAGMNYIAFIVKIFEPFQNMLQNKPEGESLVRQLSFQT